MDDYLPTPAPFRAWEGLTLEMLEKWYDEMMSLPRNKIEWTPIEMLILSDEAFITVCNREDTVVTGGTVMMQKVYNRMKELGITIEMKPPSEFPYFY